MLSEDNGQAQKNVNAQVAISLVKALPKTVPVYYALGNHEIAYRQHRDKDLCEKLQKAGAKVLEKEYEDLKIKNNKIRMSMFLQKMEREICFRKEFRLK